MTTVGGGAYSRPQVSGDSVASLERKASQCAISGQENLPSRAKKSRRPSLLHEEDDESEIEYESEDDGFEHPHQPNTMDLDADGEHDMEDELDADEGLAKLPQPVSVCYDDDGESEVEEVEDEDEDDEPEIPLASLHKATKRSQSPQSPPIPAVSYLHVSHKLFPPPLQHNRPFGELNATVSTQTIFARDSSTSAPFVPYARAPPPYSSIPYARVQPPSEYPMQRGIPRRGRPPKNPPPEPPFFQDGFAIPPLFVAPPPESSFQQHPYPYDFDPPVIEQRVPRIVRRPYVCFYKNCTDAFPSPKDRGRHMDKHFEGRFECLRCRKKYARLDALKRHCSERFRPKRLVYDSVSRSYVPAASCTGAYEAGQWVELSESLWLMPEHAMNLRLPDTQDPLYAQVSRLIQQAQYNTQMSSLSDTTPPVELIQDDNAPQAGPSNREHPSAIDSMHRLQPAIEQDRRRASPRPSSEQSFAVRGSPEVHQSTAQRSPSVPPSSPSIVSQCSASSTSPTPPILPSPPPEFRPLPFRNSPTMLPQSPISRRPPFRQQRASTSAYTSSAYPSQSREQQESPPRPRMQSLIMQPSPLLRRSPPQEQPHVQGHALAAREVTSDQDPMEVNPYSATHSSSQVGFSVSPASPRITEDYSEDEIMEDA